MKRSTTISLMATIAALAFSAQSFALGGGTGGGRMGGSMAGGQQMSSNMRQIAGQGKMQGGPPMTPLCKGRLMVPGRNMRR